MTRGIFVTRAVTGILFLAQLVLGILFWTGHALTLLQLHTSLGYLFVLSLWALAILCALAGAPKSQVAVLILWGGIVAALGSTQVLLLPGPLHWIVRVVHLLVEALSDQNGVDALARNPHPAPALGLERDPILLDRA